MLGKLTPKVKLPLDVSIRKLKEYSKEMPNNLYSLSSRQSKFLERMLSIIKGMEVPERMTHE